MAGRIVKKNLDSYRQTECNGAIDAFSNKKILKFYA